MNQHFSAQTIAHAAGACVKTIRSRARREQWPLKWQGKRVQYQPPYRLQKLLKTAPSSKQPLLNQPQVLRELSRAVAVAAFALEMRRNTRLGVEEALTVTASRHKRLFAFSPRALRRWVSLVSRGGLAALQERKVGVVGRKPMRLERILR